MDLDLPVREESATCHPQQIGRHEGAAVMFWHALRLPCRHGGGVHTQSQATDDAPSQQLTGRMRRGLQDGPDRHQARPEIHDESTPEILEHEEGEKGPDGGAEGEERNHVAEHRVRGVVLRQEIRIVDEIGEDAIVVAEEEEGQGGLDGNESDQ